VPAAPINGAATPPINILRRDTPPNPLIRPTPHKKNFKNT
jgi:hypothetical protein